MLELKNITKFYDTGSFKQRALNKVSITFKQGELVSILGPSGSGKTTLLNIIGGLDRYTSGDLIINGKSTKNFKDVDWDSYRNNSIGFVFQSYNLINHITVLDNVGLALTLSGSSSKEKKEKAMEALEKVGLIDHIYKRPNQLSGGQKQRVAIARALVNEPDIILLDEPTGALDSVTSKQILDLVKEVAKDKLMIMVTHNADLAYKYSNRIVELKDGKVIKDTRPAEIKKDDLRYEPKKTSMGFFTALKLSFNNLRTKLVRSLITSFAASIGIIGVALVLSIANGFSKEIGRLERESLSGMPVSIQEDVFDFSNIQNMRYTEPEIPEGDYVISYDIMDMFGEMLGKNIITKEYIDYLESLEDEYYDTINYNYDLSMFNLLTRTGGFVLPLNARYINFSPLPKNHDYTLEQFEVLSGRMPEAPNELVLVTDNYKRINNIILNSIGIKDEEEIAYDEIIGKKFISAHNDDFYVQQEDGSFIIPSDLNQAYENGYELEIVGIIMGTNEVSQLLLSEGIAYDNSLIDIIFASSLESKIVEAQNASEEVIVPVPRGSDQIINRDEAIKHIGGSRVPIEIQLYTRDFDSKERLKDKLDEYNVGLEKEDQIVYTDLASQFTGVMSTIIDGISIVLIAFAGISLVVSSIMIGIITYVSVLERTKEIGILRSLGARKKDVSRVFNAETFLIGLSAGLIGVVIAFLLTFPLNAILSSALNDMMTNIASLNIMHAIILIIISVILTFISGLIPARIAANKDPVDALRVEG